MLGKLPIVGQIAYTDIGSADNQVEQGLDLRNTTNKSLNLTTRALKASTCPDAILFLPGTMCSSRLSTRNSEFLQLAEGKKLSESKPVGGSPDKV